MIRNWKSDLGGWRRVLAGFMAFLFVVTAVLVLYVTALSQSLGKRETMKEALDIEQILRQALPVLIAEVFRESALDRGLTLVDVNTAVWQEAVNGLIPPDWITVLSDSAVEEIYDFLETDEVTHADIVIETDVILTNLRGVPGQKIFLALLESMPVCHDLQVEFDLETDNLEIPGCVPQDLPKQEAAKVIHEAFVNELEVNSDILNRISVNRVTLIDSGTAEVQFQLVKQLFRFWQNWSRALWLLPLFFLALIAVLVGRSWDQLGFWWGWPMAVAGLLSLLLGLSLPALLTSYLRTNIVVSAKQNALAQAIDQLTRDLIESVTDLWLPHVYAYAAILLAVGIALIIIGYRRHISGYEA